MKSSAAKIGVDIALTIESSSQYYGKAVFGQSDWLDGAMSLVDYGHRSVPNVFLTAPLQSSTGPGTPPTSRTRPTTSCPSSTSRRPPPTCRGSRRSRARSRICCSSETPIIYPYFYNYLTATASNVQGVEPTAIGHLFLFNATKSSTSMNDCRPRVRPRPATTTRGACRSSSQSAWGLH